MRLPALSSRILFTASVLLGLGFAACQQSKAPHTQAPSVTATAPAPPKPQEAKPAAQWHEMSHTQKLIYMKEVVTPQMAKSFQAHDPEEFANFNCATCHGPSAAEGNFEMPTPALPRLGDFELAKQEHPKDMAFMMQTVVPQMAKLLHEPPFDPQTQKGFGCFECHLPAQNEG